MTRPNACALYCVIVLAVTGLASAAGDPAGAVPSGSATGGSGGGAAAGSTAADVKAQESRAIRRTPVVDVFERCRDAVVNISSTQIVEMRDPFEGFFQGFFDAPGGPRTRQYTSVGSGFVIHSDGYIVTNAHVVSRTAERKAIFADGREYEAELVAIDTERDVAMLKIKADRPLHTLKLGRSDDLMVGETAIAIGNPFGYQHTVTAGVVSALHRDLDFSNNRALSGLIQTDTSINPGNSGGPLLNVLGELIGVNTAIRSDAQNIGFAIPVDQLREVLPELLDVERRYRIETGMKIGSGLSPKVESVTAGSPADKAGIHTGDAIVTVDDRPIVEAVDYHIALIGRSAGERVSLRLERDGKPISTELELAGRPRPDGAMLAIARFGLELRAPSAEKTQQLRLAPGTGLEVASVKDDSPLVANGVRMGDMLVSVGRFSELSLDKLGELLEHVDAGDRVSVTFRREERRTLFQETFQIQAR